MQDYQINYCGGCTNCCVNLGKALLPGDEGVKIGLLDVLKLSSITTIKSKLFNFDLMLGEKQLAKISYSPGNIKAVLYYPCAALTNQGCLIHNRNVNDGLKEFINDYCLRNNIKPSPCDCYPSYVQDSWRWIDNLPINYCHNNRVLSDYEKKCLTNEMIVNAKLDDLPLIIDYQLFKDLKNNNLSHALPLIKKLLDKDFGAFTKKIVPESLQSYLA
ncbi:MAG: hypothetical protein WC307_01175 [Candidatus Nanoarchaeia archaeon]|jgi:hypothetical protein